MVLNFADSYTLAGPNNTAGTFEANNSNAAAGGQTGTSFKANSFAVMKNTVRQRTL